MDRRRRPARPGHPTIALIPGPPPAINSATYVEEFNEVKAYGKSDSTVRSDAQSQTALFFSDAGIVGIQGGLRKLATDRMA